jgi:uncharacterized membrane protein YeiH
MNRALAIIGELVVVVVRELSIKFEWSLPY